MSNRLRVMQFVTDYIDMHGYAPLQREIADAVGIAGVNVGKHLRVLCKLGYLSVQRGKCRGIAVRRRLQQPYRNAA